MHAEPPTHSSSRDDFAALYSRCHFDLLRYVLTLLPDRHRAEDVVQETARMLWRKFDEYDPERPFWPWARQFAHFEVLKARRRMALQQRCFSDELIEQLAEERVAAEESLAAQREALAGCVERLEATERELVASRYSRETSLQQLAVVSGRSRNALYLTLHRIRQRLVECVNRALKLEGWT